MGRVRTQRGIRLDDDEWEAIRQAAQREGKSATEWARGALVTAAGKQPEDVDEAATGLARVHDRLTAMERAFGDLELTVTRARYGGDLPGWILWCEKRSWKAKTALLLTITSGLMLAGGVIGMRNYTTLTSNHTMCSLADGQFLGTACLPLDFRDRLNQR